MCMVLLQLFQNDSPHLFFWHGFFGACWRLWWWRGASWWRPWRGSRRTFAQCTQVSGPPTGHSSDPRGLSVLLRVWAPGLPGTTPRGTWSVLITWYSQTSSGGAENLEVCAGHEAGIVRNCDMVELFLLPEEWRRGQGGHNSLLNPLENVRWRHTMNNLSVCGGLDHVRGKIYPCCVCCYCWSGLSKYSVIFQWRHFSNLIPKSLCLA